MIGNTRRVPTPHPQWAAISPWMAAAVRNYKDWLLAATDPHNHRDRGRRDGIEAQIYFHAEQAEKELTRAGLPFANPPVFAKLIKKGKVYIRDKPPRADILIPEEGQLLYFE